MKRSLNKKERLEVYKKAKMIIKDANGLCKAIHDSLIVLYQLDWDDAINPYTDLEQYSEIYKRKPLKTYDDRYWFKEGDWVPRMKILNEAIKELES